MVWGKLHCGLGGAARAGGGMHCHGIALGGKDIQHIGKDSLGTLPAGIGIVDVKQPLHFKHLGKQDCGPVETTGDRTTIL